LTFIRRLVFELEARRRRTDVQNLHCGLYKWQHNKVSMYNMLRLLDNTPLHHDEAGLTASWLDKR